MRFPRLLVVSLLDWLSTIVLCVTLNGQKGFSGIDGGKAPDSFVLMISATVGTVLCLMVSLLVEGKARKYFKMMQNKDA